MKPLILLSSQFAHTINTSAIGEFVILKQDISKTYLIYSINFSNVAFSRISGKEDNCNLTMYGHINVTHNRKDNVYVG